MDNNSSSKFVYVESDIVTPDYSGRRSQKTTISDVSVKKRVLLVCVYNKKGTLITHDIIYRLFMKYGEIYKILIFDKCKNWKIFVEMATLEQAEKARDGLNNYQLFEDGSKMTVYYAKVDQIVFQNNNSGGVDYRELKQRKVNQTNNFQSSGVINSAQNLSNQMLAGSPNFNPLSADSLAKRTINPNGSQRNSVFNGIGENHNSIEKHRNNSFDYSELYREFETIPNTRVSPQHGSIIGGKKNSLFQNIQPVQISKDTKNVQVEVMNDPNMQNSSNDLSNCEYDDANNLNQIQQNIQRIEISNSQDQLEIGSSRIDNSSPQSEKDVDKQNQNVPFNFKSSNDYKSGSNTAVVSSNNFNNECGSNHLIVPFGNQPNSNYTNNNEIGSFSSTNNNNPENLNGNTQLGLFNKGYKLEDEDDYEAQDDEQKHNAELNDPDRIKSGGEGMENIGGAAQNDIDPSRYVNPLYILENKKSRVIYVRGLEKKNLTTKKIYNLFSNFGNIELILYFTEKKYCLIQFENQEDATIAKEHLDMLKVESNQMRIFYSNYETIKENQEGEKQCEVWKGEKSSFRFRYGKQISINPVTNTLHVSNLKQDTCKQEVINEKFSLYGQIEGFHPIQSQNKFMCHVKFSTTEEAINALCNLHEEEILGRKMHISFTRARISPQQTPDGPLLPNQVNSNNYSSFGRNSNQNNLNMNNGNLNLNLNSSPQIQKNGNIGKNSNQMNNLQKNIPNTDPINDVSQTLKILNDDEDYKNNHQQLIYPCYPGHHPVLLQQAPYQYQPITYIATTSGPVAYSGLSQMHPNQQNQLGFYAQYPNQQQHMNNNMNMHNKNFNLFQ
ncbi:hypothetical protein ABPG74_005676 [Tetrahymena malaccensis]